MPLVPRVLRHRDFALLWSGQSVSVVGDGIYTIAIALEALRLSDHASTLAYVEAARIVPNAVLLLFAGAVVDRLPRRLVVLAADALRAGAVAALAALVVAHALSVTELVFVSVAVGVGDAFFYPAYRAIMPELLPADLLTQGNAFNSASQTVGVSFVGPVLGGVLVAAGGTSSAFAVDAGSFVVSALCLVCMSRVPAPASSGKSLASDARQGFRWTMRQRWLWYGILAAGVANFAAFSPTAGHDPDHRPRRAPSGSRRVRRDVRRRGDRRPPRRGRRRTPRLADAAHHVHLGCLGGVGAGARGGRPRP